MRYGRRRCHTTATFVPFVLFVDRSGADTHPALSPGYDTTRKAKA
jgi:hypothetical protein